MMAIVSAECTTILLSRKNCITVKRNDKWHVRRYGRDVRRGIDPLNAVCKCHYLNLPTEFHPLFK